MVFDELISKLMTADELATSRIGIMTADRELIPIVAKSAEKTTIDARTPEAAGPACELVVADARGESVAILRTAFQRLSRDGILVAAVCTELAEAAARTVTESGADWVAILRPGEIDCYIIAAMDLHPVELGPLVTDHVVHPPRSSSLCVPQNRDDRAKRRYVRRQGRARMMGLASRLLELHGDAVRRVVTGIEELVGERPAKSNTTGAHPGMFGLPDIELAPWPNPARWPRLRNLLDTCDRFGQAVCTELREFVASQSLSAYLEDDYNKNKFQLSNPGHWKGLRLFNRYKPTPALPPHCRATREMLSEFAGQISGELTILRLAPRTSLPPHFDDYGFEQYIHIGLTVPPGCGIRVAGEARTWEEGRALAFTPAFLHEAWNHSESPRDVLAIDTWHSDLTEIETDALHHVRTELEALRAERRKNEGHG